MPKQTNSALGIFLKERRKVLHMTQKDVADAIAGLDKEAYAKLEQGKTKEPSMELTIKLAEVLEVGVETIVRVGAGLPYDESDTSGDIEDSSVPPPPASEEMTSEDDALSPPVDIGETQMESDAYEVIQDEVAEPDETVAKIEELKRQFPSGMVSSLPAARPGLFPSSADSSYHRASGYVSRQSDMEEEARHKAELELYESMSESKIMTGKCYGVQRRYDENAPGGVHVFACYAHGPFVVYIPIEEYTDVDMVELNKRQEDRGNVNITVPETTIRYLQNRLDAEIDFIVMRIPKDENGKTNAYVLGSRLQAMRQKRIRYWYGKTTDGKDLIKVGDKCEARIIAVASRGIRVEVFGVEAFIDYHELSWAMIQDARTQFFVGHTLSVKILDIIRHPEQDYAVEYKASVKAAQSDPRDVGMEMFMPTGEYRGTIAYIRAEGDQDPRVFVRLADGVQCACEWPSGPTPPMVGCEVRVFITHQRKNMKHLFGRILHVNPPSDWSNSNSIGGSSYGYTRFNTNDETGQASLGFLDAHDYASTLFNEYAEQISVFLQSFGVSSEQDQAMFLELIMNELSQPKVCSELHCISKGANSADLLWNFIKQVAHSVVVGYYMEQVANEAAANDNRQDALVMADEPCEHADRHGLQKENARIPVKELSFEDFAGVVLLMLLEFGCLSTSSLERAVRLYAEKYRLSLGDVDLAPMFQRLVDEGLAWSVDDGRAYSPTPEPLAASNQQMQDAFWAFLSLVRDCGWVSPSAGPAPMHISFRENGINHHIISVRKEGTLEALLLKQHEGHMEMAAMSNGRAEPDWSKEQYYILFSSREYMCQASFDLHGQITYGLVSYSEDADAQNVELFSPDEL